MRRLVGLLSVLFTLLASGVAQAAAPELVEVARVDGAVLRATPGPAEGHARRIAARIPQDLAAMHALLGQPLQRDVEIRVGVGRAQLRALAPPGRIPPTWAAGVAFPDLALVLLDADAADREGEAQGVLRHELAHVALGQLGEERVPRWFTEGFAVVVAGEGSLTRTGAIARAAATRSLIELDDLERGWPSGPTQVELAYAQSASFVAHLAGERDGVALRELFGRLRDGQEFHAAFRASFRAPVAVLELDWREGLQGPIALVPLLLEGGWLWIFAAALAVAGAVRARQNVRRRIEEMDDEPFPEGVEPEPAQEQPHALPGLTPEETERLAQWQTLAGLRAPAPPPMAGPMPPPAEDEQAR